MTLREKIEVMEAFERGEEIEVTDAWKNRWITSDKPTWDWFSFDYRIKPKKQPVTIEKYLCLNDGVYFTLEGSHDFINNYNSHILKVKLLDTYEVEI